MAFINKTPGARYTMTNYTGNISTIVKWISMLIAGWAIGVLASNGLDLTVDSATLAQVISAIIFLLLGLIDAKYPNTILNKSVTKLEVTPTELEEAIKTATDETSTPTETKEETVVEEDDQQYHYP